MTYALDTTFSNAVRVAAKSGACERLDESFLQAFREASCGDPSALDRRLRSGASLSAGERDMLLILDYMLRNGTPLGEGERDWLDQLDRGKLRPVRRAGERGGAITPKQQIRYAARYLAGGSNKQIMEDLVKETGMSSSTILDWVAPLRKSLARAPNPDLALRQIIDPEGEARMIRDRVDAASRDAMNANSAEPERR